MLNDVREVVAEKCPVDVIEMRAHGMIRGDRVLARALKMAGK